MKVQIYKNQDFSKIYIGYKPELIALIKSTPGAKYEPLPIKKWKIPTSELENLLSKFTHFDVEVEYTDEKTSLVETPNEENKEVKIGSVYDPFFNLDQCMIKLPVPKCIFTELFRIQKKNNRNPLDN